MYNRCSMRVAALLAVLLLGGCAAPEPAGADQAQVMASFYVLADFAGKVAGERAVVVTLAGGGDPHDWEPTPRDIAALEGADLLLLNGGGFEHWADTVVPALQNPDLTVLVTAGEGRPGADPHYWLDPLQARGQLEAIAGAMCEIDPQGAELYTENRDRWAQEMELLNREFEEGLAELAGRELVTSHAAFGHLCARYGLVQVAVQDLSPDGEPDPARMAEIIRMVEEREIPAIFFEPSASPKVAEAIARETGAAVATLDPLEGLAAERIAAGEDYFSVMRDNLANLRAALL